MPPFLKTNFCLLYTQTACAGEIFDAGFQVNLAQPLDGNLFGGIIILLMITLKQHTSFPESLRTEWNVLLAQSTNDVPFLRYEYLEAWWQTRGGGEWLQASLSIITAHEDGNLIGVAPFFHTINHAGQPAFLLLGSIEISDYLDLIVRPQDLARFVDALLPYLLQEDQPQWAALDFYNLLDHSPTLAALQDAAQRHGLDYRQENLQHSPFIPLPGDWEAYLSGIDKKQRHEIRRKIRRAEESELPVQWYIVEDADSLEAEAEAFLELMAQDPEKAVFLTPQMRQTMKSTIQVAFTAGSLQLVFLTVNGAKAAAYLNFDYGNRIWVYNSGLNRQYMEYSPGWVLLGYLLQWSNHQQRTEFDFMRGNEDYKYRFGAIDRFVVRATLSRPA